METRVLGPGEAYRTYTARSSTMHFKALAEIDGGDFSLMERTLPPGGRQPPPHRHTNCSEAYFVLDGIVSVTVDGRPHHLAAEQFVLVPRGVAHTFGNLGSVDARLLVLHAPAMDAYFAALHDLWSGPSPPTTDDERELMSRFGMETADEESQRARGDGVQGSYGSPRPTGCTGAGSTSSAPATEERTP